MCRSLMVRKEKTFASSWQQLNRSSERASRLRSAPENWMRTEVARRHRERVHGRRTCFRTDDIWPSIASVHFDEALLDQAADALSPRSLDRGSLPSCQFPGKRRLSVRETSLPARRCGYRCDPVTDPRSEKQRFRNSFSAEFVHLRCNFIQDRAFTCN